MCSIGRGKWRGGEWGTHVPMHHRQYSHGDPTHEQNDIYENIIFPQLALRAVIIKTFGHFDKNLLVFRRKHRYEVKHDVGVETFCSKRSALL